MTETECLFDSSRALERAWNRAPVHAPRGDESLLAVPPLADAAEIARRNHALLQDSSRDIQGRPLAHVRSWARREIYRAARDYTAELLGGDAAPVGGRGLSDDELSQAPFFVGGHQPTLFHPGVWVKNFAVHRLAAGGDGVGLNLVVDSDTLSSTAIRVPSGTRDAPTTVLVPFDEPRPREPWQEARIKSRPLFDSFADRVRGALGDFGFEPLVGVYWPAAVERSRETDLLAECLTAARSRWERSRGIENLELPISRLCELEPFQWFACHILARLPEFVDIYNAVVREYRAVNGVRSRTHPVPDLGERDGWLEAPFRVWRAGDSVRKRVYARQFEREIHLSDGESVVAVLPLGPEREACCAVKELSRLSAGGLRFRTRALTTTLFARVFCADLFVHGIGGARYDEMTDRIMARFYGQAAPEILTLSGTVHLPVAPHPVQPADERRLLQQLRELDYNSDRCLSHDGRPRVRALIAGKQELIARQRAVREGHSAPAGQTGYERFRGLQEINRELAGLTLGERRRIEDELDRTRAQLAANRVLMDREYAFCLYPAEKLNRFLDHASASAGR